MSLHYQLLQFIDVTLVCEYLTYTQELSSSQIALHVTTSL